jgi:hypothetical protein
MREKEQLTRQSSSSCNSFNNVQRIVSMINDVDRIKKFSPRQHPLLPSTDSSILGVSTAILMRCTNEKKSLVAVFSDFWTPSASNEWHPASLPTPREDVIPAAVNEGCSKCNSDLILLNHKATQHPYYIVI